MKKQKKAARARISLRSKKKIVKDNIAILREHGNAWHDTEII